MGNQSLDRKKLRIVLRVRSLISVFLIGTPFSSVGISVRADSKYSFGFTRLHFTSRISNTKSRRTQRNFGAYCDSSYSDLELVRKQQNVTISMNMLKELLIYNDIKTI